MPIWTNFIRRGDGSSGPHGTRDWVWIVGTLLMTAGLLGGVYSFWFFSVPVCFLMLAIVHRLERRAKRERFRAEDKTMPRVKETKEKIVQRQRLKHELGDTKHND